MSGDEPKTVDGLRMVDVCQRLGRSRKQVERYVALGYLQSVDGPNGARLYTRESVEATRQTLGLDGADGSSQADLIRGQAELIRAMSDRERVLLEHERLLVKGRDEFIGSIVGVLRDENNNLRTQVGSLYSQAQEGLNKAQEREMAQIAFVTKTERENQALGWLEKMAGEIISQVRSSGQAAKLVQSMNAEMIDGLRQLLSPDQFDMLLALRRGKANGTQQKPDDVPAEKEKSNGQSS